MKNSLVYETNGEGYVLSGSNKDLLESVKNCSDLKIGLEATNYEEIVPLTSVAYTEDYIIGIQPYHTASETLHSFIEGENSTYKPYSAVFLFTTERIVGIFRYRFNGSFKNSHFPLRKNTYNYYRWFVNDDKWQVVYDSGKDFNDTLKKDNLIDVLKNEASDLKLSFSYKGITYIVVPNITYFPKATRRGSLSPIRFSVKTHPILLFENTGPAINWKNFQLAELIVNDSAEISILTYHRFDLPNKSVIKLRRILSSIFNKKEKITHFKFQGEVKWYIKL